MQAKYLSILNTKSDFSNSICKITYEYINSMNFILPQEIQIPFKSYIDSISSIFSLRKNKKRNIRKYNTENNNKNAK